MKAVSDTVFYKSKKNHRLAFINGFYQAKYSVRNSLNKLERTQQFILTA